MNKEEFLHVGPPTVRLLPLSILMSEQRHAVVSLHYTPHLYIHTSLCF